ITTPISNGSPGGSMLVRDFRGMNRSDALLYDPVDGTAYVALSNGNATYQYVYNLFTAAFGTLRTGDFNGDGKADLVVYNSHTASAPTSEWETVMEHSRSSPCFGVLVMISSRAAISMATAKPISRCTTVLPGPCIPPSATETAPSPTSTGS